jgi:DNA-binding Lrp family transcriptional regulator
MPAEALILLRAYPGAEKKIIEEIMTLDQVNESDIVFGEWDIVFSVALDDVSQLNEFILNCIRPIGGIQQTSTLIVAQR